MKENYFGLEVHTHLKANLSDIAEAVFFPVSSVWGNVSVYELKNSYAIYSLSPDSHFGCL